MKNNMVTMCLAQRNDLEYITSLIQQAKSYLKALGINQWQQEYPDAKCIENDIILKNGYLLLDDKKAVGYICIDFNGDPSYDDLKGKWKSAQPYAAVHRLVIEEKFKGRGCAVQAFQAVEMLCRQQGIYSIKVDTDEGNLAMKHILQKSGFEYCGTILFDYSEKIAFEKQLV